MKQIYAGITLKIVDICHNQQHRIDLVKNMLSDQIACYFDYVKNYSHLKIQKLKNRSVDFQNDF